MRHLIAGTRHADVTESTNRQQRVSFHTAYPAFPLGIGQQAGKVGALKCDGIIAIPDVRATLGVLLKVDRPLVLKDFGKPRIVFPVGLNND